jgi:hypothetical protein
VIRSHEELDVYKLAFDAAMRIFEASKRFPLCPSAPHHLCSSAHLVGDVNSTVACALTAAKLSFDKRLVSLSNHRTGRGLEKTGEKP